MKRHSSHSYPLDDRAQCHPAITPEHLDHCAAEALIISIMPVLAHIVHFSWLIVHDVLFRSEVFLHGGFQASASPPLTTPPQPDASARCPGAFMQDQPHGDLSRKSDSPYHEFVS